jgi:hypothetical protein
MQVLRLFCPAHLRSGPFPQADSPGLSTGTTSWPLASSAEKTPILVAGAKTFQMSDPSSVLKLTSWDSQSGTDSGPS